MIKVYHTKNWNSYWSFGTIGSRFPKDYMLVAEVESDNLDDVFQLTNHIESDWTKNKGVRATLSGQRSSSVGDLFIDAKGDVHLVASVGFIKMGVYKDGVFTPEKMKVWALLTEETEPAKKKLVYYYDKESFKIAKRVNEQHGVKSDSWEADLDEAFV